ncbi:TVP38/TMEM64 family protein [Gigaspora margarita]|uniref:TVP38/TMEM64 family protein n=1 Tax=Gigaspora margarita TaxID=4874 RepID=A0A8H4AFL2_GIGMA|nr:TVP38/TMEM64 family protein [Gigaspora margarita]
MIPDIPRNEDPVSDLSTNDNINLMANNVQATVEYPEDNVDEYNETSTLLPSEESSLTANEQIASQTAIRELNNKVERSNLFSLKNFIRLVLLAMFITLVVVLLAVFKVQNHIKDYLHYIEIHERYGIAIYLSIYVVCVWVFLPGSIISIAAGFLFKPAILAGLVIIMGDTLAAAGAFIFGRYVFSDWVIAQIEKRPKISDYNNVINNVIAEEGWKIVLMLRLSPLPFNLVSYIFSVSTIDFITFLWATIIGVLPGAFNAVWIGSLAKSLSKLDEYKMKDEDYVIITMNFIFVGCCVVALSLFGKRSLRKAMLKLQTSKASTNPPALPSISHPTADVVIEESLPLDPNTGLFTRGERITLYLIGVITFLNIVVNVSLYYYFKSRNNKGPDYLLI